MPNPLHFTREKQEKKYRLKSVSKTCFKISIFLLDGNETWIFFTKGYGYLVIILPTMIVAPMYFAGKVEFGQISQASFAFGQVLGAFSIIIQYFDRISAFAAGINRVSTFKEKLFTASGSKTAKEGTDLPIIQRVAKDTIRTKDLTLQTPDYKRTLIQNLNLDLDTGKNILIMGHSGAGKSSLLRGHCRTLGLGRGHH